MVNKKIWVEKGFQTSINIAYDLHNENKIKSFIPTVSSIDVIEDILLSTSNNSTSRARFLVGAYGKGKSHIVLILMALLSHKDKTLFKPLLNKIKKQNSKLYEFVVDYISSDKKLLPIIVSGSSASLTQSFLGALHKALKNEDLSDLMPETNFKSAIATIKLWSKDYPETYNKFAKSITETVEDFIIALKEFDMSTYEKFNIIYPELTSGSSFNPFTNVDVVELYEDVVGKLKAKGFNGIYIIYDEFSKYLESSIANATISDIKLLQDFAEKCDRSGDKQMHLMLISHKDISNYIDKNLPKEKVDGWRGVSGRFKHINLHNNFSQMYEIIATVIKKDKSFWTEFQQAHTQELENLVERFTEEGNRILTQSDAGFAISGCYPLHPISTFILPRLSEKVAQNERTLFTFLSSDNKHTLPAFLEQNIDLLSSENQFTLLTPDYIYDYFEPLFRKEPYTSDIHKMYMLTANVLRQLEDNSLGAKIVKTIALIYIVEQFEKLPPIQNIIVDTFIDTVSDISEIECVLKELIEKDCIVYLKRSNGYLKIKESSGVDISAEIEKTIQKTSALISVKEILNKASFDNYMYPTAYNDDMEITRYLNFHFIDSLEFFTVENWDKKIENLHSDGVVYAVVPDSEDDIIRIRTEILSGKHNHQRIMFILPKKYINIEKIAYEYYAINLLKTACLDDDLLSDEYDIYIEDLEEVLNRYISSYTRPELGDTEYFYSGEKQLFKRKAQVSAKLSEICKNIYPYTPIINNESINKDSLPTVAINSRNKIISGLLENDLSINLGLTGTGQDVSIMRSTLLRTGILENECVKPKLNLAPEDENMCKTLQAIQEFFNDAKSQQGSSFKDLYDTLTLPQSGFGIKKGVIPIFIACVLHSCKKYLVIKSKNEEVNITVDILNSINETPDCFTAYIENWNDDKTKYIEELSQLFSDFIIEREKDFNTFSYVVSAMQRWYMNLPKYAKELKTIYKSVNSNTEDMPVIKEQLKFINSLKKPNIKARDYLFNDLLSIFNYNSFNLEVIGSINAAKCTFDNAKGGLIKHLISDIKSMFSTSDNKVASLTSIVKDYIDSLKVETLDHLYPNGEHRMFALMKSISNDEQLFVEQLAKEITNLRIDDWTRTTITEFLSYLGDAKKVISDFNRSIDISTKKATEKTNGYKIAFVDESGEEVIKTFDKTEYSSRAKLLYNEIATAIDEMGQSISESEKRQILMDFIEKMC
ncbi:hypothetical protein RBG61_13105 [Paludicola sp. MB14-C6]|uniref:hypothetical protein n=1 Tax=Paludihabitans sp. MB14-C6 TaxID=3070656 RepID=UPI0027DABEC0|nr:hypothetical protein [Paludicola sp. MB14-C6]WMJ22912.1 hypothetical protein RBG61_13105 [Paludicola sp. MB14-C6]